MNSMIRHLRRENNLTEEGLRQLYRRLSKETHPDLKGGDGKRDGRRKSHNHELNDLIFKATSLILFSMIISAVTVNNYYYYSSLVSQRPMLQKL